MTLERDRECSRLNENERESDGECKEKETERLENLKEICEDEVMSLAERWRVKENGRVDMKDR